MRLDWLNWLTAATTSSLCIVATLGFRVQNAQLNQSTITSSFHWHSLRILRLDSDLANSQKYYIPNKTTLQHFLSVGLWHLQHFQLRSLHHRLLGHSSHLLHLHLLLGRSSLHLHLHRVKIRSSVDNKGGFASDALWVPLTASTLSIIATATATTSFLRVIACPKLPKLVQVWSECYQCVCMCAWLRVLTYSHCVS